MTQINKLVSRVTGLVKLASAPREQSSAIKFEPNYMMPRPFKPLPNVSELRVRPNMLDPLLAREGISRKLSPEMEFEEYSWRIKAANRYLDIMQSRLEKHLRSNELPQFWVLALLLMSKSVVIRSVALRKLNRNWHREFKFGLVKLLLKRLGTTIASVRTQLHIVRQYEDKIKPDGTLTYRPVGNPAYVDRMYTYMLQCFLVMFLGSYIDRGQHAYRPGKGVNTALKEVSECLKDSKYKYIWEFDLKGAFPSVNIIEVCKSLSKVGCPQPVVDVLEAMCITTVERVDLLPDDQVGLLPEPKFERQSDLLASLPSKFNTRDDLWSVESVGNTSELPKKYLERARFTAHLKYESEYSEAMELFDEDFAFVGRHAGASVPRDTHPATLSSTPLGSEILLKHGKVMAAIGPKLPGPRLEIQGFPQGLGFSPVLFNFAFEVAARQSHFIKLHPSVKVVSYADDFLVFSHVPLPNIYKVSDVMSSFGLVINKEKSRAMKENGIWCVDKFKFLGTTFVTVGDTVLEVVGTSRKNPSLVFDKMTLIEDFKKRDQVLRKVAKFLLPKDEYVSPQEMLNMWGLGAYPWRYLPLPVVQGDRDILDQELNALRTLMKDDVDPDFKIPSQPTPIDLRTDLDNLSSDKAPRDFRSTPLRTTLLEWAKTEKDYELSRMDRMTTKMLLFEYKMRKFESQGEGHSLSSVSVLVEKFKRGEPLNVFGSRIAGLMVNRMFSGTWIVDQPMADRSLKSPLKTGGRS
jgi:hypothetical protein